MMTQHLGLFPMTREQCAIARYQFLLNGYNLSCIFVPKFWMLEGEDISCLDGGTFVGINTIHYDEKKLALCDVLYIDYDERLKNLQTYQDVISDAEKNGVKIICSDRLAQVLAITKRAEKFSSNTTNIFSQLYEIPIPIVTVLSQGIRTDQFATELALRQHFVDAGVNVLQLGSNDGSKFFGFTSIPQFVYEPMDYYTKILHFNHYLRERVNDENPDLVIISISDAIMKYNDQILLGLGIVPSIICNAIKSDFSILCMYYSKYNREFLDGMSNYCNYRLGCPVGAFGIANTSVEPDQLTNMSTLSYFDLNSNFVTNSIEQNIDACNHTLFNILNSENVKKLCLHVEGALTSNPRNIK